MSDVPGGSRPPASPLTSIVISSRDRPTFVVDVLESIRSGAAHPDEVIVVDQSDAPSARIRALAGDPTRRIRYLWGRDRGLSRGRNAGVRAAHGELLVFVDDDVLVPPDWFGRIVAAAVDAGPRAVVTGRVVTGSAERPGAFAPSLSLAGAPVVHRGRPGRDVLMPHNMAIYRAAFAEVGPFDERLGAGSHFPSSEDNDLGYRLLEAGYAIVHDPSVVVVHRAWRTPGALVPLRWAYGRGQGAYFAKHATLRDRYMLRRLWADLRRHLRRAPRRLVSSPRQGLGDLVYGVALLAGAAEWLITRRR